jgi:heme-degrading monooxygenase HmoA
MVRATLHVKVRAGREQEFEHAWRSVAAEVRRMPGQLRQALLRDPRDPTEFVITSDWESQDAFCAFERSPDQDTLTAPLRALRESAVMSVHELIVHLDAGKASSAPLDGPKWGAAIRRWS